MKLSTKIIALGGIIAAVYVALTFISATFGLSSGFIQLRLSEALCVLPMFTPAAIPGLFVGCLVGNLITGATIVDIVFGSLATLIGAIGTYLARQNKVAAIIPPIIANTLILPLVFIATIDFPESFVYYAGSIFISEVIMVGAGGALLCNVLEKANVDN